MRPADTAKRPIRCAIYTRKSTEEGLDQEFNSLDAQRECAEAYILSQRAEGWTALQDRYDDGGFTGANVDRQVGGRAPALGMDDEMFRAGGRARHSDQEPSRREHDVGGGRL